MACRDGDGPKAVLGTILECTGAVVSHKLWSDHSVGSGTKTEHKTATANPEHAKSAVEKLLGELGIHEDDPAAIELLAAVERGELTLTEGQAEACRTIGPAIIDHNIGKGKTQCEACGRFVNMELGHDDCVARPRVKKVKQNQRTDIHRPSAPEFNPEEYVYMGSFSTDAIYNHESVRRRKELVSKLVDQGYKFGHGSSGQCGHCGAHMLYSSLMVREDVKEFIFVGEDCLENRFFLTKPEFQVLRENMKAGKAKERAAARKVEFLQANPEMANLRDYEDYVLADMARYLDEHGELSENQIRYAKIRIEKDIERRKREEELERKRQEREVERQKLEASGVTAPEGKVSFKGEILATKTTENAYGLQFKMLVESEEGWRVWVTVPKGLNPDDGEYKGKKISMTANLTRSEKDSLFAFGKNPSKTAFI